MSSASMVTPSAASSSSGGGGDNDDVGCRACYGVVVACLSLLLFCVLAGTVGVIKACAVTGLAVAFLGFVGWLALPVGAPGGGGATAAQRAGGDVAAGATTALRRARHAFGLVGATAAVHVPPAFVYECPVDAENGGGGGKPGGCGSLCAVCLEDVQRGEAVRLLPACGHLFHMECVDMWLHSHTTCPLCRSDLLAPPRNHAAKSVTAAADAVAPQSSSSTDVLPPV